MKNYHFFPVFLTLLASYIGLHLYSASWFSRSFAVSPAAARGLRLLFLLLALAAPFAMFLRHHCADLAAALDWFYTASYAWMGIIFLAGAGFIFADFLKHGLKYFLTPAWLRHYRYGVLAALGFILAYAFYAGLKVPEVKELRIAVPGLPPSMEGIRIAQISDIHLDSAYKLRRFSDTVDSVKAAKPDLVLFTGDLVDPGLTDDNTARLGGLVRELKSRLGIYGVFGNHEYYYGYEKSIARYREFGIKLLRNEGVDITDPASASGGSGGTPALLAQDAKVRGLTIAGKRSDRSQKGGINIRLIGLGDILTEKMTEKDVKDILKKHRRPGISILMTHQPVMYSLMAENGDFVGFSGHIHGGQLFPFHLFTRMFYKYFYGLYRVKNSVFYVTSGAGTWGPPLRWLAPSEIPIITLTAKASD